MCLRVLKRSFLRVAKRSFLRVAKRPPDLKKAHLCHIFKSPKTAAQAFCLRGFSDKLQTSTLNFAESWSLHRRLRRDAEVKSVKFPARCGSSHTQKPPKKKQNDQKNTDSIQKPVNIISQCCTILDVSVCVPLSF